MTALLLVHGRSQEMAPGADRSAPPSPRTSRAASGSGWPASPAA